MLLGVAVFCGSCEKAPSAGAAPVYRCRVVKSYPHDRAAFTQGLVFDGGYLYEGTGLYGASSLRKVGLRGGAVLLSREVGDEYFGEGVAVAGERIVQLTWREGVGFVYDKATFARVGEFAYEGEGWGLAFDGARWIMSNGTARLRFLDAGTFAEVGGLDVHDEAGPVKGLNELECVDGMIYANIWPEWVAAMISPETGRVEGWIDLTGVYEPMGPDAVDQIPNGIAYDAAEKRLFVTGKLWPAVFEVQLVKGE
jgi:glutamine cyclotransferase